MNRLKSKCVAIPLPKSLNPYQVQIKENDVSQRALGIITLSTTYNLIMNNYVM